MAEVEFSGTSSGSTTTTANLTVQLQNALQLINRDPEPNEVNVIVGTLIVVDVTNVGTGGVDVANTTIQVNGVTAYDGGGGGFQAGFNGSESAQASVGANSDAERWTIDPTSDFSSEQTVTVRVISQNSGGTETIDETYTFTTEDLTAPVVTEAVGDVLKDTDPTSKVSRRIFFAIHLGKHLPKIEVSIYWERRIETEERERCCV